MIDGTATATVAIDADDTLSDVVSKINALNRGVTASMLNDGTRQRLSLSANKSGAANELLVDTSDTALVAAGNQQRPRCARALRIERFGRRARQFEHESVQKHRNGLDLTVNNGTLKPVTVNVESTSSSLVARRERIRGGVQFDPRRRWIK